MNGVPLSSDKEAMKKAKTTMKPGATAAYTVLRDGREVTLNALLSTMPEEMVVQHIQKHMQAHHPTPEVAKN
jgi:S1-C subfamily serine protease